MSEQKKEKKIIFKRLPLNAVYLQIRGLIVRHGITDSPQDTQVLETRERMWNDPRI